jgi:hypothetical protein
MTMMIILQYIWIFFVDEIWPNFNLDKGFFMGKKWPKFIPKKNKNSKYFYDKFQ